MSDEAQSRKQRKLRAAARRAAGALPTGLPPVLFLTDEARTPDPAVIASHLPAGWGVVFRRREMDRSVEEAARLAALCRRRGLVLLVAGAPSLAMQIGAHGVHWPERRASEARRWAGRFTVMTASAHTRRGLARLASLPVDAVLRSVVFDSASASAGAPIGALRFRMQARRAGRPVYALGGVTADTAPRVSGVAGLAAIEGVARIFRA